jgi:hypothetical protein
VGSVAVAAAALALIGLFVVVASMRSGPQDGPYVVNATDRTLIVERDKRFDAVDGWRTVVELGPDERASVTIACGGRAQVRAFDLDGELVAATELEAEEDCSGEWVIEAGG